MTARDREFQEVHSLAIRRESLNQVCQLEKKDLDLIDMPRSSILNLPSHR